MKVFVNDKFTVAVQYYLIIKNTLEGLQHAYSQDYFGLASDIGWILLSWMILNMQEIFEWLCEKFDDEADEK